MEGSSLAPHLLLVFLQSLEGAQQQQGCRDGGSLSSLPDQ